MWRREVGVSPRERRLLRVLGVCVVIAILARALPAWWLALADRRASEAELLAELEQARLEVRALGALEARAAEAIEALRTAGPHLLGNTETGEAVVELTRIVRSAADRAGARIQSVERQADRDVSDRFSVVAVRIQAEGSLRALLEMLADVEGGEPLLRARRLGLVQELPPHEDASVEALRMEVELEGVALRTDPQGDTP